MLLHVEDPRYEHFEYLFDDPRQDPLSGVFAVAIHRSLAMALRVSVPRRGPNS